VVQAALDEFVNEHRRTCGLTPEGGAWVGHVWACCPACERRLHFCERDFTEIRRRLADGERFTSGWAAPHVETAARVADLAGIDDAIAEAAFARRGLHVRRCVPYSLLRPEWAGPRQQIVLPYRPDTRVQKVLFALGRWYERLRMWASRLVTQRT